VIRRTALIKRDDDLRGVGRRHGEADQNAGRRIHVRAQGSAESAPACHFAVNKLVIFTHGGVEWPTPDDSLKERHWRAHVREAARYETPHRLSFFGKTPLLAFGTPVH
jgi:hypothetical protein